MMSSTFVPFSARTISSMKGMPLIGSSALGLPILLDSPAESTTATITLVYRPRLAQTPEAAPALPPLAGTAALAGERQTLAHRQLHPHRLAAAHPQGTGLMRLQHLLADLDGAVEILAEKHHRSDFSLHDVRQPRGLAGMKDQVFRPYHDGNLRARRHLAGHAAQELAHLRIDAGTALAFQRAESPAHLVGGADELCHKLGPGVH